jgi:adhesin transport system membrane fusion protein
MGRIRNQHNTLSQEDLEFITDAAQGELMRTPKVAQIILWMLLIMVGCLAIWAYFSSINEIVRGEGKAIPISHTQVIQNLDGGIIEAINIREGQTVRAGDLLMSLDATTAGGALAQTVAETSSLVAEEMRLVAEVAGVQPEYNTIVATDNTRFVTTQLQLYKIRQDELHKQIEDIHLKASKARQELVVARQRYEDQKMQASLIRQQLKMNQPLLKMGAVSESVVLEIKQQLSRVQTEVNQTKNQIPELESEVERLKKEEESVVATFKSKAQQQLAEVRTRLDISKGKKTVSQASLNRTELRSPVDGIIQKLYINTVGGVVRPGVELIDIVPIGDELLVEARVKPKDIGFVRRGQTAKVKVSAFDFAIYGGLNGTVETVSADTITDKKGQSYYLVKVHVDKAYFDVRNERLNVIPGMQATVDISVAERTVLEYIMKPLLRALQR